MRQRQQNPVAKYCHQFNKPKVEENKTSYKRKEKHNKKFVDYLIVLSFSELLNNLQTTIASSSNRLRHQILILAILVRVQSRPPVNWGIA